MNISGDILDVNEVTFEVEVLLRSHEVPVVVDFWAPWCRPCQLLGPILERRAIEAGGAFRLARVDVDQSPSLAIRYGVQGIPAVKAFRNGEVVSQFVGQQPDSMVRRFLEELAPSEKARAVQDAKSLLATRHWMEAEQAFREVWDLDETNAEAALGLVKSLLIQGKGDEALSVFKHFPPSNQWAIAESLMPLAKFLAEVEHGKVNLNENQPEAQYHQAARLIARGNLAAAMDGLLEILRQDKNYRKGEAKQVMVALFSLMGDDDPLMRKYRSELASILF